MRTVMMGVILTTLMGVACAQSGGGYDLSWWTIDGGGITFATGGSFNMGGTVGQPDASNALTGGTYSLTGASGSPLPASPRMATPTAVVAWTTLTC